MRHGLGQRSPKPVLVDGKDAECREYDCDSAVSETAYRSFAGIAGLSPHPDPEVIEHGGESDWQDRYERQSKLADPFPSQELAHSREYQERRQRRKELQPVRFQEFGEPGS